jgi:hypothetical protein
MHQLLPDYGSMGMNIMKTQKVSLNLPFNLGGVEFVPNHVEQKAAWSLYVELITRIAVQPFDSKHGVMREVLASLYSLFSLTRQVLRDSGPEVAHGPDSLGPVAIKILTEGLAPFTTRWHPRLRVHELTCPENVSPLEHERSWKDFHQMQRELAVVQAEMKRYADILAEIAGVT